MREPFLRLFITKGLPEPSKFKQAATKNGFTLFLCAYLNIGVSPSKTPQKMTDTNTTKSGFHL